jgi:hypothetical protein
MFNNILHFQILLLYFDPNRKIIIMAKVNLRQLKVELARNIVKTESFRDSKNQSICRITIGGIEAVSNYCLAGQEKQVLANMVLEYWSVTDCIGRN